MKRQSYAYMALGLAVSAALLYLAFRGADWGQIADALRDARADYLVLAWAMVGFSYFLRGFRWRVLLAAERSIPTWIVFLATSVGYLGNNVLPARAGELIRSVIIGRVGNLRTGFVFATALTERVLDTGALVLASLLAMAFVSAFPGWLRTSTFVMGALVLGAMAVLFVAPRMDRLVGRLVMKLPLPQAVGARVADAVDQFLLGMRAFQHGGRALAFAALTAVIWFMDGLMLIVIAKALHQTLDLPQAILLITAFGLASALPSMPGYVGVYQFVAVTALVPFGFSRSGALAYSVAFQAIMFSVSVVLGSLGLLRFGTREFGGRPRNSAPE